MTDQRITQLTELPQSSIAANDPLPIVDVSASETKKITFQSLANASLGLISPGSIDLDKLDQNSVTKLGTVALADDAVTAAKLADDSAIAAAGAAPTTSNFDGRGWFSTVTSNLQIHSGGAFQQVVLPTAGIADAAVTNAKLAPLAVTTDKVSPLGTAAYDDLSVTTVKLADDAVTAAKIAANTITAAEIAPNAIGASELANNSVDTAAIVDSAVTSAKLGNGAVTAGKIAPNTVVDADIANTTISYGKLNLADGSVPGAKLAADSVTNAELAPSSVGTTELINNAVTGLKIAAQTITAANIAADTLTAAEIAPGAIGTSELTDSAVTVAKLQDINGDVVLGRNSATGGPVEEVPCTAAGRQLLAGVDAADQRASLNLGDLALANGFWVDGSSFSGTSSGDNTGDQTISLTGAIIGSGTGAITTIFGTGTVTTAALANAAVSTDKIADGAITAEKIAGSSTVVIGPGAPVTPGVFTGQLYANNTNNYLYYYDGAAWAQTAGFTALSVNDNTPISWSVTFPVDANSPVLNANLDTQAPNTVWAGPSTGTTNQEPTFRLLVGADLPAPAGIAKGGVYQGEGTLIESDGEIHLAPATDALLGGVYVSDANLQVDQFTGALAHTDSLLAAGTYTKVTTDARGHIVGEALLEAADIPSLPAAKITSGTFAPALFAGKSITREALADYAITYIQEENPGLVTDHIGCLWLQESSGQLRMWNGNSWFPVGFGRLAQENLRWGGTIDASTDQVAIVTQLGASAGLTVGNTLPAASDSLSGVYVVVDTAGAAISVTPGVSYDIGDWVLCVSQAQGWVKIDAASSGGGGGADFLGDLFDVTISAPIANQVLTYNGTLNQWQNLTLPTAAVTSVFGRTGVVVATEGDYSLDLLGDVDLTTTPPSDGNLLRFNSGTGQWRPVSVSSLSVTTTQGDMITRGATVDQRLPIGLAGQVLTVNGAGTAPIWQAPVAATETTPGTAAIATQVEVDTGLNDTKIITPLKLANTIIRGGTF